MSLFPKATRSTVPEVCPEPLAKKSNDRKASKVSQDVTKKPALHLLVTALQEKQKDDKVSTELWHGTTTHLAERPSSARQHLHHATGHGHEKHPHHAHAMVEAGHGHEAHPHHAHTMLDDHLKTKIDHSLHWTQLLVANKPHKQDFMEKAKDTIQRLRKSDDVVERLKEDPTAKVQQAALMSRVAGHIVIAIEHETTDSTNPGVVQEHARKTPLRTAKSLKRDAAIDKLAKVMDEQHRIHRPKQNMKEIREHLGIMQEDEKTEQAHNAETAQEEEQDEDWKLLTFDGSPARKREHKESYTVITQRRKKSLPHTPGRERKGDHPLDLISILEVMPHTPPRAQSAERSSFAKSITVHASDFIKYGNDVEMLKKLKLESPCNESLSVSEHVAVGDSQESHLDHEQSTNRRVPGMGISDVQAPFSRGQRFRRGSRLPSRSPSRPSSARASIPRPGTARQPGNTGPPSPSQPHPRPSSARTSRPLAARQRGEVWSINREFSRPDSERSSCPRKSRPTPFLPLKGQTKQ